MATRALAAAVRDLAAAFASVKAPSGSVADAHLTDLLRRGQLNQFLDELRQRTK